MEIISITIDLMLLLGGLLAMRYAKRIGGSIGHNSLDFMAWGFVLLGIAHLVETVMATTLPALPLEELELTHRLIVLAGLGMLLFGYRRLAKFVSS